MELTAMEDYPFTPVPLVPPLQVYFRKEYFAELPGHLLTDVKHIMAESGGFEYKPLENTITALHRPQHYRLLCERMVTLTKGILNV